MPEQVEAAPQNQGLARVTHDCAYFLAMAGSITMDLAVLAGRFRLERATLPARNGIKKKTRAGSTIPIAARFGQPQIDRSTLLAGVMSGTVNAGKQCQHAQVTGLFTHRSDT